MIPARYRTAALIAAILVVFAVLMAPAFNAPALEMDEGGLLAYPVRVLHGAVPQLDFEVFYGPGTYWLLAVPFKLFGPSLAAERAVGLILRLAIVAALFLLLTPYGRLVAGASALLCGLVLSGTGLIASPGVGALALALAGLTLVAAAVGRSGRAATAAVVGGGVVAGLAILCRFDFVAAVALGLLALLPQLTSPQRRRLGAGFVLGLILYVPHLLLVGATRLARIVSDIRSAAPGRSLPLDSLSADLAQLFAAEVAGTVVLLVIGVWARRRGEREAGARLLALGGVLVGLQPYALSRLDHAHIALVASLALGALPLAAGLMVARARHQPHVVARTAAVVLPAALVALLLAPGLLRSPAVGLLNDLVGRNGAIHSWKVEAGGRSFRVSSADEAHAVGAIIRKLDERASPGDTLFVGPRDLRRTSYADTFIYFLAPQLRPASYYMELNPGTANRSGSGLAADIARSDFLVLNRRWDDWSEANESSIYGPDAPNEVVRRLFCVRARDGTYELMERCRPASSR